MKILSNTPPVSEKIAQYFMGKPAKAVDPAALKQSPRWRARPLWAPLTALYRLMFRMRREKPSGKKGLPFAESGAPDTVGGPRVEFNPRYHHPDVTVSDLWH
jgi:hypothetical protein